MRILFLALAALCLSAPVKALELAAIFSDGLVLQAEKPITVWGRAAPGRAVSAKIGARHAETTADADGRWDVALEPKDAGAAVEFEVTDGTGAITFDDVLVGDVWIAAGQSNMAEHIGITEEGNDFARAVNRPHLRMFRVENMGAAEPLEDVVGRDGRWLPATKLWKTRRFTTVGYHFGKVIKKTLGRPVGIVNVTWGGALAESFIRRDTLKSRLPDVLFERERFPAERANRAPYAISKGMVQPLSRFPVRGVIWYQGESHVGAAAEYREIFPALIEDWRDLWDAELPFLFVQLPNYRHPFSSGSLLANMRDAQRAALSLPGTAKVVTIDLGWDEEDSHIPNKPDIGRRLALQALAKVYGHAVAADSPSLRDLSFSDGGITVHFDHADDGLVTSDGKAPRGFAVAGDDCVFVQAPAEIAGNTVRVSASSLPEAKAVRYAWADNPPVNLYNRHGLPAAPFRTDDCELAESLTAAEQ